MKEKYNMLHLKAYAQCSYDSYLPVPASLTLEESIDYAKLHIKDIPLGTMKYIPDSDMLYDDDISNYYLQPLPDNFDPNTYKPSCKTPNIDPNEKGEFFGSIIDMLEDFFTEKGLDEYLHKELQAKMEQPNDDPNDDTENSNIVFWGEDYDTIRNNLEDILTTWHLLP